MASISSTIKVEVTVVIVAEREMTEQEFKQYLLRILREAINDGDALIIQPGSNQALILKEDC